MSSSAPRVVRILSLSRRKAIWCAAIFVGPLGAACDGGAGGVSTRDPGVEADAGPDSGSPMIPAHERVDCDLPAVIEYCGGATCHNDNANQDVASRLALWDRQAGRMLDDVPARVVGVPATYQNVPDPENCPAEPELLVDPLDAERSLILKKLTATQSCGVEMPKFPYPEWGTVAVPGPQREEFTQCIRAWVALLVEDYNQTE